MKGIQIILLLLLGIPCTITDLYSRKLPTWWMFGMAVTGLVLLRENLYWFDVTVNLGITLLLFLLYKATKGAIGMGDVVLAGCCGCILAWEKMVQLLMMAFVIAAAVAGVLILLRRVHRHSEIPFAPCLLAGILLQIGMEWSI